MLRDRFEGCELGDGLDDSLGGYFRFPDADEDWALHECVSRFYLPMLTAVHCLDDQDGPLYTV